jgi:hypothetical protein
MISWLSVLLLLITNTQPSYASTETQYQQQTITYDDTNPQEFDPQDFLATEPSKVSLKANCDISDDNRDVFIQCTHSHTIIRAPPVI